MTEPSSDTLILPDLGKAIMEQAEKRIKISPQNNNRASQAGAECERSLVLSRTRPLDRKPHDPTLQRIFDLGNLIEYGALRDLGEAGITVVNQQRFFDDKRLQTTGHIDGDVMVERPDGKHIGYPLEIKGLVHHTWLALNEFSDFLTHRSPWIRKYPAQLTLYMYLEGKEWGCFLLFSKQTFEPKCIWIPLDYDYAESLLQKLERVNKHVADGTLPEQIDDAEMCAACDFFNVCLPEIKRDAITIDDDPELAEMIERWYALKPSKSEYDKLDKLLKKTIAEHEKALVGDFLITGKWVDRKGYVVEDSRYWKSKIVPLAGEREVDG